MYVKEVLHDFNVHPQKREVRFREGRLIHDFVRSEVKKALAETKPPLSRGATREEVSIIPQSLRDSSLIKGANLIAPFNKGGAPNGAGEFSFAPLLREPLRFGNPICQLKGLFILAESPEGLIIIDMHAAHERVLYERLKQNWHEKKWESQLLLFPQPIELSKHEEATFKEHQTEIAQMGFGIDAWMDHKIMLREVPVALAKANLEQFIHDLLQDLSLLGAANTPEIYLDQILAEVACHSAIQAHQTLSMIEMMQLLKDMENTPNIDYCNHGRPTWRLFKTEEMNRLFLRGR